MTEQIVVRRHHLIRNPPLEVEISDQPVEDEFSDQLMGADYHVKSAFPKLSPSTNMIPSGTFNDYPVLSLSRAMNGEVSNRFPLTWGVLWLEQDTSETPDDFFVLWGLLQPNPLNITEFFRPNWWESCTPWCSVLESGQHEGSFATIADELPNAILRYSPFDASGAATDCVTTRRPMNWELTFRIKAVDFLGRRTFRLYISSKLATGKQPGTAKNKSHMIKRTKAKIRQS